MKELFAGVSSIGRFRPHIDDVEYQTIIDSLALKPRAVKLTNRELKILRILASDPRVSLTTIAQKTGFPLKTTLRTIEKLYKKVDLWFSILVDVNRIGLSEHFVLLKVHPEKERPVTDLIWEMPYCTRIYKAFVPMNLFVRFNIPFSAGDYLHQYLHQLRRANLVEDYAICRVQKSHYNINFRYYDVEKGRWDVRWDEWGLWLREFLFEKGWYSVLYEEATKREKPKAPVEIEKLDLQIINQLVLNSRQPFTEIGRELGITGVFVSQKVHRLINEGVIRPIMGSYRIGLDDVILIAIDCNSDVVKALSVALNELPLWQGFAVTGDINGLIAMVFMPAGAIGPFFHAIDTYLVQGGIIKKYWPHVVGKWIGERRPLKWLPIELYSKGKGWIFRGDKYIEEINKHL